MDIHIFHSHRNLHNAHDQWYWDRFYHYVQELGEIPGSYKQAYIRTEADYYERFSTNRYGSYESFKVIKYRRTKRIRSQKNPTNHLGDHPG